MLRVDRGRPAAALDGLACGGAGGPRVEVDRCAGFVLRVPGEQAVEIFPDAVALPHDVRGLWRIFPPAVETPHFVVDNDGWDENQDA